TGWCISWPWSNLGPSQGDVFVPAGPSRGADPMVRARAGGVAELGCSLDPPPSGPASRLFPLHVVEWVRLGYSVPILIKFGVYTPRVHPDYRGRVSLSRGASLLLRGLRLEDEGWFECRILLLDRATDEFRNGTWTFLSVTGVSPPTFLKTPPPFLEALLGDSVTLVCVAHGNPQPSVTWKKDDLSLLGFQLANGTLTLASVTREEAGTYKCHVSNAEGNLTHATQLLVKGPPIIIISPEDATLNMSQDAVLQCQAEAYPANLSYMWWREGEDVHHIESLKFRVKVLVDGSLLIPSLVPEDAGNYTCMPSNGLLTPPTASAYLTVRHPAQVMRMPRETYLPAGMGGVITCPIRADPPMLYVNWTKDGDVLNLDMFPGWMVNSEGSVFIATANDDAVGVYTCTAYNSYGTMGESDPTSVLLQDPPSFKVVPRAEYLQEVGRELVVPCQARGDPAPNTTWSKVGSAPRSSYTVAANGSLVLRPLSKDHQGAWECQATNRVATVSTSTMVLVLGTSPHAVLAVSVVPEVNQLNVSWEPGFDGGYTQKFTVWSVCWVKQASRDNHEWTTLPVPPSKSSLLVTGLLPGTKYQLSVLPQNKLGSGPFSEIATGGLRIPPTALVPTAVPKLAPPSQLSVNQTSEGIVVQWAWPPPQAPPITGFVLQARQQRGQWQVLDGAVGRNSSEVLVQGLLKDSIYELRLLSVSDNVISEPSESVSVSTAGMEVYPARRGLLHFIPEPLLAGVVGGVCFLFVAILLSLAMACIMGHRREQRRRKRRDGKDLRVPHTKSICQLLHHFYIIWLHVSPEQLGMGLSQGYSSRVLPMTLPCSLVV
uniref:Immunoglobulin superfamily, member 9b n=1 Tax=Scleropages formosus TaxID=113540 RepID=A0A8C9SQP5_SCLFO